MLSLQIISGTDRSNSNALNVSKYLKKRYENEGTASKITDLQDFPLQTITNGKYRDEIEAVKAFNQPLLHADGIVFVCPEYNGGYPGILKLFIDYLPYPASLNKKPVCFVGEANSPFGGLRAVEQLQQVIGFRNAHMLPERVFISRVKENFDEEKGIKDDYQQNLLETQIQNFIPFVEQFK